MMSDNDPFCARHGVPFDAFEGCWRCVSDAAERENAKREISNQKDAEIARLRADLERSQSEHRHTMHVMDGMQDEIEKLRAARLRPETVAVIRVLLGHLEHCDVTPEVIDDWWRCYHEEV